MCPSLLLCFICSKMCSLLRNDAVLNIMTVNNTVVYGWWFWQVLSRQGRQIHIQSLLVTTPVTMKFCPFHDGNGPMQSTWLPYFLREWFHIMGYSPETFVTNFSIAFLPSPLLSNHIISICLWINVVLYFGHFSFHAWKKNNKKNPVSYSAQSYANLEDFLLPLSFMVRTSCQNYLFLAGVNTSYRAICTPGLNCCFKQLFLETITNTLLIQLTCDLRAHSYHFLPSLIQLVDDVLQCMSNLMVWWVKYIRIFDSALWHEKQIDFRHISWSPYDQHFFLHLLVWVPLLSFNLLHWRIISNFELKFRSVSDRFAHDKNVMVFITLLMITSFRGHCLSQVEEWLQFSF